MQIGQLLVGRRPVGQVTPPQTLQYPQLGAFAHAFSGALEIRIDDDPRKPAKNFIKKRGMYEGGRAIPYKDV